MVENAYLQGCVNVVKVGKVMTVAEVIVHTCNINRNFVSEKLTEAIHQLVKFVEC